MMPQIEKEIVSAKLGSFVFPEVQIAPLEIESDDEIPQVPILLQAISL
jgi:hypothetical protein